MRMLTLFELKQFKGFENVDESLGLSIINALFQFSIIAFNFFHSNNYTSNE